MPRTVIFHGGCHGCTRQLIEKEGLDFCIRCQYFDADWSLPDLNNRPEDEAEIIKREIKARHNLK